MCVLAERERERERVTGVKYNHRCVITRKLTLPRPKWLFIFLKKKKMSTRYAILFEKNKTQTSTTFSLSLCYPPPRKKKRKKILLPDLAGHSLKGYACYTHTGLSDPKKKKENSTNGQFDLRSIYINGRFPLIQILTN